MSVREVAQLGCARSSNAITPYALTRHLFRQPPGRVAAIRPVHQVTSRDTVAVAGSAAVRAGVERNMEGAEAFDRSDVDSRGTVKSSRGRTVRGLCGCQADIVVLGLGASGTAVAKVADQLGHTVLAIDEWKTHTARDVLIPGLPARSPLKCWWGEPPVEALDHCRLLILSPGVTLEHKLVQAALARQTAITSELAYAMDLLPRTLPTIAITGTNGKSTTIAFVSAMLCQLGLNVWTGGNFGEPVSCLAAAIASGKPPPDIAVIEVSSYQLEAPGRIQPYAAAILNLSMDHLDRHGDMQEYARTKMRLVSRMPPGAPKLVSTEVIAYARGITSAVAREVLDEMPGLEFDHTASQVKMQHSGWSQPKLLDLSELRPVGHHNRRNAGIAAFLASAVVGESRWDELQASIIKLTSLPHRIEAVHSSHGVTWISDSKATNVNAVKVSFCKLMGARMGHHSSGHLCTLPGTYVKLVLTTFYRLQSLAIQVALESIQERSVILLGGQGKTANDNSLGFAAIAPLCDQHVVITFGQSGEAIKTELALYSIEALGPCKTLADAVCHAKTVVKHDRSIRNVLLSPGCASFDEFQGFEDRGCSFAALAAGQA